jgi:hypothetical protein
MEWIRIKNPHAPWCSAEANLKIVHHFIQYAGWEWIKQVHVIVIVIMNEGTGVLTNKANPVDPACLQVPASTFYQAATYIKSGDTAGTGSFKSE